MQNLDHACELMEIQRRLKKLIQSLPCDYDSLILDPSTAEYREKLINIEAVIIESIRETML